MIERRITAAVAVFALLAAPAFAPAAVGFHDPDSTTVAHERTIEGPFWFVYRVNVTDAENVVSYELDSPTSENRHQTAYGLWTKPVEADTSSFFVIGTGGTRVTEADIRQDEPVPFETHHEPLVGSFGETSSFAITHTNADVGEYWFVIVNTMPSATSATVRLYVSDGVSLVATAQGTEGDLHRETEFETDEPYYHVRTGALTVTAQAHSVRNATLTVDVDHSLFGIFTVGTRSDERIFSHDRPDGTTVTRDWGGHILDGEPGVETAGTHTFRLDSWQVAPRAAPGPDAYVALLWADVELP